ncbi:hypothetical protein HAX54_038715 [Datura stramonium]|uniref:non-specific serine/threonine protein kinase n=1 Tax=Datura stramonium TaxID=4076 RepID=A0ABS8RMW8_DATST|nr:hypothetical protein [Datura stramonium]
MVYTLMTLKSELLEVEILYDLEDIATFMVLILQYGKAVGEAFGYRGSDAGNFDTLADPRLDKNYDTTEMTRMVTCAAVCVRHLARRRPRMSQLALAQQKLDYAIVRALEGNLPLDELNEGLRPGHSGIYESYGSSDFDARAVQRRPKKFRKMALESQAQNSSEWKGLPANLVGIPLVQVVKAYEQLKILPPSVWKVDEKLE